MQAEYKIYWSGPSPQPHAVECDLQSAYHRDRTLIHTYIKLLNKTCYLEECEMSLL